MSRVVHEVVFEISKKKRLIQVGLCNSACILGRSWKLPRYTFEVCGDFAN